MFPFDDVIMKLQFTSLLVCTVNHLYHCPTVLKADKRHIPNKQITCSVVSNQYFICDGTLVDINSLGLVTPYGIVEILVNTGSGNGLLPDGTKPLPEQMFTYHQ